MSEPREQTAEETREIFLNHIKHLVKYWARVETDSKEEALDGLAFSILVSLDGGCIDIPRIALIPYPHPEDMEYNQSQGENWHRPFDASEYCDIGGSLHESFSSKG
jgi:hypothetical protein